MFVRLKYKTHYLKHFCKTAKNMKNLKNMTIFNYTFRNANNFIKLKLKKKISVL